MLSPDWLHDRATTARELVPCDRQKRPVRDAEAVTRAVGRVVESERVERSRTEDVSAGAAPNPPFAKHVRPLCSPQPRPAYRDGEPNKELRIELCENENGSRWVSLRVWIEDRTGHLAPGRAGVTVRVGELPDVIEALIAAAECAPEHE